MIINKGVTIIIVYDFMWLGNILVEFHGKMIGHDSATKARLTAAFIEVLSII